MIHTDGQPTVATAPRRVFPAGINGRTKTKLSLGQGQIRGQMTVEDCIRQAQADELEDWYRQQGAAEPQFGGY